MNEEATLASIHSPEENDLSAKLLDTTGWINGVFDEQWIWDDGSPWDFLNPLSNGTLEDRGCLQMNKAKERLPTDCEETCQAFLCKRSPLNEKKQGMRN